MKNKFEEKLEKAIEWLQPINYQSFDVGYYVLMNENDEQGSDFCENCIAGAVRKAKKYHKEKREEIKAKYKLIETKGYCFHNGKKVRVAGKYTPSVIAKSKRDELKQYPAKAIFTYEGHDPDFGGGLNEPCCCEQCGEYFTCNFTPDMDEAKRLLEVIKHQPINDRTKWELEIALRNYQYAKDNVKAILKKVVDLIILKNKL